MKWALLFLVAAAVLFVSVKGKEFEDEVEEHKHTEEEQPSSWWSNFKKKVKSVLLKWRDDMKVLWDEVLAKATDMKSWTAEVFESFKAKLKQWLDSRPEVPDDEKNEIETFISKLKLSTEKPSEPSPSTIDP